VVLALNIDKRKKLIGVSRGVGSRVQAHCGKKNIGFSAEKELL